MSFDWQTEEESDWDDNRWQEKPETAVPTKPPWRTILLVVALLSVAGFVVYQQVKNRLDAATANVESDIFATHNLLSRAAANQDGELGKSVFSGRDLGWSRTQTNLMANGLFYEHGGMGLLLPEDSAAFAPLTREDERLIALEMSPNLNSAELLYARDYLGMTEGGIQQVTLQQTAVYRRGETRWLFAPPEEPFWGEWQTLEIDNITFIYPARDEELVLQLSSDLHALLETACADLLDLDCDGETAVQIRFERNPESLLEAVDPTNLYDSNLRLNLPAPTLVGLPIDSDGYEALLNAYGGKLIAAFISEQIGYECCRHATMFQAVMTYQLSELGLADWPITRESQQALADSGVDVDTLFPYWNSREFDFIDYENKARLFGFVDFLVNQHASQISPVVILDKMNDINSYQGWLGNLSSRGENSPFDSSELVSRDWWFYAMTQAELQTVVEQPIPLPHQDLQISCGNTDGFDEFDLPQSVIYRYELDTDNWREEIDYPGLTFFNPLPGDDGVVLQLIDVAADQLWQTELWRNGSGTSLMGKDDNYSISLGQIDPNGRFLLTFGGEVVQEEEIFIPAARLVDVESCQEGACSIGIEGVAPIWSPDGQQMLYSEAFLFDNAHYTVDDRIISLNPGVQDESVMLLLNRSTESLDETVEVGVGYSPFWVNNDLFGFIQTNTETGLAPFQELVIVATDTLEPEILIISSALRGFLPESNDRTSLYMQYAVAHPTDANRLLLMASPIGQPVDGYLFQINRQTQEVELLFDIDLSRGEHSLGFSPDGRFLVATATSQRLSETFRERTTFDALHLYDFETNERQTILTNSNTFLPSFKFDWSLDGNWLAFIRDRGVIGLIAPAHDYQKMVIHDVGDCTSLAWVNPLP